VEAKLAGNKADPPDPGGRFLLGQGRDGGGQDERVEDEPE